MARSSRLERQATTHATPRPAFPSGFRWHITTSFLRRPRHEIWTTQQLSMGRHRRARRRRTVRATLVDRYELRAVRHGRRHIDEAVGVARRDVQITAHQVTIVRRKEDQFAGLRADPVARIRDLLGRWKLRLCPRNAAATDLSAELISGGQSALEQAQAKVIRIAVLKKSSPSCGSNCIHEGTSSATRVHEWRA
jgi:hypothetical protein